MRNWYRVLTVSAVALTFSAGTAFAQTSAPPAGKPADKTDKDKAPSAAPRTGADFKGRHTMTGEVTKIDKDKGMVSLKTKEGEFNLHFPPTALKDVKEGDRLTVQLGFREEGAGAASPAMERKTSEGAPKSPQKKQ